MEHSRPKASRLQNCGMTRTTQDHRLMFTAWGESSAGALVAVGQHQTYR